MKTTFSVAIVACLLAVAQAHAAEAPADPADSIIGLWACETGFPAGLAGELTIERRGPAWHGAIEGATAEAQASGGLIRLVFPNDGGSFRGYLDRGGSLFRGFWARREVLEDLRYPEGATQACAMPLVLRPADTDRWQAMVAPLLDPFTLYLNIFRDEGGVLRAAIRFPCESKSLG
jgi:hypothetical protein